MPARSRASPHSRKPPNRPSPHSPAQAPLRAGSPLAHADDSPGDRSADSSRSAGLRGAARTRPEPAQTATGAIGEGRGDRKPGRPQSPGPSRCPAASKWDPRPGGHASRHEARRQRRPPHHATGTAPSSTAALSRPGNSPEPTAKRKPRPWAESARPAMRLARQARASSRPVPAAPPSWSEPESRAASCLPYAA